MTCAEVDIDDYGNPIWMCECGAWNDDGLDDECQACGRYWE